MKKAFTITELLVAVGLLAAVLTASMIIFNYSIEAQRTAMATAEIMRTLRSITDQLNYDFAGVRKDAPVIMNFHGDTADANKADSIVFFATGSFQTMDGEVRGNTARIYYGQSGEPDPNDSDLARKKILARKQIILAPAETSRSEYEYEPNSLAQQINTYLTKDPNGNSDIDNWIARPDVNPADINTIPMYLAKGVDDFSIMYCYKSDIDATTHTINWQRYDGQKRFFGFRGYDSSYTALFKEYPALIKFTFTLYDSKGILKGGKRFEHIVYIGN